MEAEQLIEMMKCYDFKKNSASSFASQHGISVKSVLKYLRKASIPYNKSEKKIAIPRDNKGRYCLKILSLQKII